LKLLIKMAPMGSTRRSSWSSASESPLLSSLLSVYLFDLSLSPFASVCLSVSLSPYDGLRLVNNANPTFAGNFKRALEDFDVNDVRPAPPLSLSLPPPPS
jgi:hypothetical protein